MNPLAFVTEAGKIAGIGGLALGVFLLLFRKIRLPQGSRRHLTLFMWLVWSICALGILAFVVGHYLQDPDTPDIPEYRNNISITYPDDGKFVEFLESNLGRTVKIASYIEMSLSNELSYEIENSFGIESFREDPSIVIPIDGLDSGFYLQFDFIRPPHASYGGTGIVQFSIDGYFSITRTYHSGPSMIYHLTQVPVSIGG
ncbi:hypothetical protein [Desulfurivibrio alkaliphilus]|uniref:Uncharacterized protein n=1 Tax=Desulfurivibrio alkaliphilus (strain DSM 19089 / UNIQEM U267 / AHT2) TaxID=589865 RepID=D6Z689_DESAT|nr:hypothetical protein [Desulfurivibrio alkaliphilus]ADH86854.1 hypothetical protein DaAHT2_2186 [Desulfurivibrio alkaliphilus AHT 2]